MGQGAQEASGRVNPSSPQMAEAWALWNGGDKVAAKRVAERILQGAPPPELAAEAQDLLTRLNAPWQAYAYGLFAAAVIAALILLAVLRT
jgi:hypothetical protein